MTTPVTTPPVQSQEFYGWEKDLQRYHVRLDVLGFGQEVAALFGRVSGGQKSPLSRNIGSPLPACRA